MRTLRRLAVLAVVVAAGVAAVRFAAGAPGPEFAGRLEPPMWGQDGPAVLIDASHWNDGTRATRLRGLAGLLTADGYVLLPDGNATRAETLSAARIGVIVNPLGVPGVLRVAADRVGLGGLAFFDDDGLILQELETTVQWVENGGSLLVAADESPRARGSQALAARFGVTMRGRPVVDVGHAEPSSPGWLVFSRENGLVGAHPVVDGIGGLPPVNRVVVFGAQALDVPAGAVALLRLGPSATEVARAGDPPTTGTPVEGRAVAVALSRGRGRVVVLGDSHLLTNDPAPGGVATGLEWPSTNNTRFVRAVFAWLARRDEPPRR